MVVQAAELANVSNLPVSAVPLNKNAHLIFKP